VNGAVGTVQSRIDVHYIPITPAQRKKHRLCLTERVREHETRRSHVHIDVHQRFASHQCTRNDNTARDFFDLAQTHIITGFSPAYGAHSLPRDGVKNHLRDVSRAANEIALCPFHRRGKFFAQLARKDRPAERNRSKTSESGATDSP
jgi:hypothetical protein